MVGIVLAVLAALIAAGTLAGLVPAAPWLAVAVLLLALAILAPAVTPR